MTFRIVRISRKQWFQKPEVRAVEPGQQYRHPGVNQFGRPHPVWEVSEIRRGLDNKLNAELRLVKDVTERKMISLDALRDASLYEPYQRMIR